MESTPPGLMPLNTLQLQKATTEENIAIAVSSSSHSDAAVSPPLTETIALSPLHTGFKPVTDPKKSGGNPPRVPHIKCATERAQTTPASVSVDEMPSMTPRSKISSSFSFPLFGSGVSNPLFFKKPPLKEKDKGKEKGKEKEKRKHKRMFLSTKSDEACFKAYPAGYRGYLETHVEKHGPHKSQTDQNLRRILGINSFSDSASIGLFSPHIVDLDLKRKVFVSLTAITRMASEKKAETHQRLLKSLCHYDRQMSFWLSINDIAYQFYAKRMRKIFFRINDSANIYSVFGDIPQYVDLEDVIKKVVLEEPYNIIRENIAKYFEEYERTFSKEHRLAALEHIVARDKEKIEKLEPNERENSEDIKRLMCAIHEKETEIAIGKSSLTDDCLKVSPNFKKNTHEFAESKNNLDLKEKFFIKLINLRNEEASEIWVKPELYPHKLPICAEGIWCQEQILEVAFYFFITLCNRRPKFYDLMPNTTKEDVYINENFSNELKKLTTVKSFVAFMQEQKRNYNEGLVEIVLYKTLEYVCEFGQVKIEHSAVIRDALEKANTAFPWYRDGPFACYDSVFFKEAIGVAFENVQPLEQDCRRMTSHSGPAPKI